MKEFWNERYRSEAYVYGEKPNEYLKESLTRFTPGKILFPAEGEGRNAVYAAQLGWHVFAFDQSIEGKKKALKLADKHKVNIHYDVCEFEEASYPPNEFDAIALIFAHFPADKKEAYHQKLLKWLKPRGVIILEAFSKKHIQFNSVNEKVGGPRDIGMLYSAEELKTWFKDLEFIELYETETELNEGLFHVGRGAVVRCIAKKRLMDDEIKA
ncbi:cyclopropane fatty-acyl-phospholipid synthase-like methyltransferase [Thermonema lapsum]|uniref:Cyclopropane fatty-acyl-phospholipid synthase-like methyltransferase n=1 Tax=Thermonema lapsum TaxID=28195 RepID=A0A846MPV3_9BACT|nr:class I SAM-dependent methyltransferase [Thermonema lapsum]NIK73584.1 cyclopropane fatty-acyl-phospholipid synthase-like methyltransferase [Thermonema lapsum]